MMCRWRGLLALLIVAGFVVASCGEGGGGEAAPVRGCDPARPHDAGRSIQTVDIGGRPRRYLLEIPKGYDGVTAMPLSIFFHGYGVTLDDLPAAADFTPFEEFAPPGSTVDGFISAWPEELSDTVGSALIRVLSDELCVDENRIYTGGGSLGTDAAATLVGTASDQLAGVSMVIGASIPPTDDWAPVPMIAHSGGTDAPAVLAVATQWAKHNGCEATPTEDEPAPGVTVTRWSGCTDGADVEVWVLADMGHQLAAPDCSTVPAKFQSVCYETEQYGLWAVARPFLENHTRAPS